jgi:hypothetical protein
MFCPRQIHLAIILIDECDPKSSPDAPFVIFQTANCLKEGVVSEFNAAAPDLQQSLQQYLIDYLIHHQHSLSNSVQQQLFQAFGILMKMKWPSLSVEARSEFIGSTIPRMLESPTHVSFPSVKYL